MKFIRHTSEQSNWLIPVIVGQTRISNRAMPLPSKWQRRFGLFLGFSIDVLGMAKKLYEQLFEFQSLLPMRVAGETTTTKVFEKHSKLLYSPKRKGHWILSDVEKPVQESGKGSLCSHSSGRCFSGFESCHNII